MLTKEELRIAIRKHFDLSIKDRDIMSKNLLIWTAIFDESFISEKLYNEKLDDYITYH